MGILLLLPLAPRSTSAQGVLGQLRNEVRGETKKPDEGEKKDEKKDEEEKKEEKKKKEDKKKRPPPPPVPHSHHEPHDREPRGFRAHGHFHDSPRHRFHSSPAPPPDYCRYYEPPCGPYGPYRECPECPPYMSPPHEGHVTYYESYEDDDDGDVDLGGSLGLTGLCLAAPIILPMSIANDRWQRAGYFPRHPYADGHDGYMDLAFDSDRDLFTWSLMAELNHGANFDGLTRTGMRVIADTTWRLGIDAEANYWREKAFDVDDGLWLGDFNLVLRFAQSPHLQWRAGIGVNWLRDSFGTEEGFNFTYGGEIFAIEPWIATATMDWGKLGNVGFFHAQSTLGVQFRGCEVFVGGDYLDIGSTQIRTVLAGVRVWQ